MQLEQILSAAVAAVNEDDLNTFTTTTTTSTPSSVPSPALPPQDSPTPPSAALHSRAPPPVTPELAEEGLGEVSFFPLDDDNLVITSQQALAMFEAPSAPLADPPTTPQRPPPLNTPPMLPPVPPVTPHYYIPPSHTHPGEKSLTELQVTHRQTFPELQAAQTTFPELPVEEKTFIEVQAAEETFAEGQEAEKAFIEVQRAEETFREVQEPEKTFIEVHGAGETFAAVHEAEKTLIELQGGQETFEEPPTFTELSVAQGIFTGGPQGYTGGAEGFLGGEEVVFPDTSFCGVPVGGAQYSGVPLTEVTLGEGEEEGVPAVSAEVEVLTSSVDAPQYTPQYTSLTPATPAAPPVVVRVAGPGLNLSVPNTFMSAPQSAPLPSQPPPQPPTPPPSRPPEHSHVLEALRASIFRSRARKRAAPQEEREGEKGKGRKRRRAPLPTSPRPPTPPPEPWGGEGDRRAPPPQPEDEGVQVQLVYLVYPVDPATGTPSQIMLSDPIMSRGQQDVSLFANPTAPKKAFEIDTTQQGHSEYKQKPMSQWEYKDIVQFFINGQWGFQSGTMRIEFNFHAISGATGSELMRFSRAKFLEFSPKYGDEIYEYMQQKIASERERERERQRERDREAPIPLYHPNLHSPTSSYNIPSPSSLSSLSSPTTTTTTTYQNSLHHHSQPSLVCDAPARYELRFESPPQPLTRYQGVEIAGEAYSVPPTASRKTISLLPPLVAIEGREREERRERAGDAGEGRSGEQSRPVEEEVKVEPPKKRGPGRPRKPENELKKKKKKTGRLWEFIRNLLLDPETCPSLVKWENPEEGLFRFMDAEKVARRWGDRKQNREMNYEKLSRAMRYYYKTHIFEAVIGRRLVYKFGKNAKAWQPDNPNFPDIHQNLGTHRDPPPPPQPPPPPPPIHHHNDPTPQPHHHNDPTPQPHLHSDSISSLHHHSEAPPPLHHHTESTSQLRHHSDPPPPLHHHQQHQPESQYHRESSPPQISIHQGSASPPPPLTHHLHHTHTLQNLTMHHHHLQSHHNT
ncbi:uncharacterized protein LOC127009917 isoform X2 [Eriocheir sinensis]|uniref:uncharacterized protein LOC127009917 isoform X2 n=1 Tax=Eriocheir sinensis TaxID=95602 RepID=UPI0021C58BAE|nr:uncharacterized protein LOC127009917 isoform X2 [Eriocheir sinensis]